MNKAERRQERRRTRREALKQRLKTPFADVFATVGTCLIAVAVGWWFMHDVTLKQALVVLPTLLFANWFEWWSHKEVMHRPRRFFPKLYQKHTLMHHAMYDEVDMTAKDHRDRAFVLLPSTDIMGLAVCTMLLTIPLSFLVGTNVACLITVTLVLYTLAYELTHLCYHLPPEHPVRKLPFMDKLAANHRHHHNPRIMANGNFNVTVPLFDLIMGTYVRPPKK